jgi:outer membrane protein with beta-barrel domain
VQICKRILLVLACAAAAATARAQSFGLGISVGFPNDVSNEVRLENFDHSEVTGWFDYRLEPSAILRLTYGNMRTRQTNSQSVIETPTGPFTLPEFKERIEYGTVGVSYLFWEGFYTSGMFAGVGAYGIRPDAVAEEIAAYADQRETVFGWHAGLDGDFRLFQRLSLVLRFTYHNISAHPHRQFINADAGFVVRF